MKGLPTGPMAGLWAIAALSLVVLAVGMAARDSGFAVAVAAVCFTLSAGFLAVSEAIGRRSP